MDHGEPRVDSRTPHADPGDSHVDPCMEPRDHCVDPRWVFGGSPDDAGSVREGSRKGVKDPCGS